MALAFDKSLSGIGSPVRAGRKLPVAGFHLWIARLAVAGSFSFLVGIVALL
ncbi:MAG: hypothetical protein QHC90_18725 [Shinella sp.]|jgi:hypothetical protein|nr:hypothetical protein [Shinella sp.]